MNNSEVRARLRDILAELYPNEPSIRRIVDDAGLDGRKINFGSSVNNIWHFVLAEAEKVDGVETLLRAVEREYRNNREFQAACKAYRQWQGKQEDVNLDSNIPTNQPHSHPQTWEQRLKVLLVGIVLIGLAGGGAYWMLGDSLSGFNVTPTSTSTASNSNVAEEKFAEETSTPAELSTPTLTANLPSPTSMATVTESSAIASAPQTATSLPQSTPTGVESPLCSFAFLVLDDQSEEPIRRATVAVFVGVKQDTGTTDSTGYYLAKLPCSNEQNVEAQVRVSADDYSPYNRSVFLSDATTEILLERETLPTSTVTSTITSIPTPSPCTATVASTGATQISLRETATGNTIGYMIAVNETVLVLTPSADSTAYQISYNDNGREIVGWLPADNVRLSNSCPR